MLTMPEGITIAPHGLLSAEAQTLIGHLNAELTEMYPNPDERHFTLTEEQVTPPAGVFLLARLNGEPVGCGALRRIDAATGELKRMYVSPTARGRHIGRYILDALEREARVLGLTRIVLETGTRQQAAIGLYENAGFTRIPPFGEYLGSAASICLEKTLVKEPMSPS